MRFETNSSPTCSQDQTYLKFKQILSNFFKNLRHSQFHGILVHKNKYMEKQTMEFEHVRKAIAKAMTKDQMSDNVHAALPEQRIFVWIKQITSQVHMESSIPK